MKRWPLFIVLTLLVSVSIPALMAQENETAMLSDAFLQVLDSEPLVGQELGLEDSITLYLSRPLDCATVPDGFRISPVVTGSVVCDANTITFTPDEPFERANTYVVQLTTSITSTGGAQLEETYEIQLDTVGFLTVSETFPVDGSFDIAADTTITVIFNRPVVALRSNEDADLLVEPLIFDPVVEGTGDWINTSIYQFTPSEGLFGGTTYEVRVAEGLVAADESVLPQDYVFSFSTQPPFVTSFRPDINQGNVLLDSPVQVRFNQVMDQASVAESFSLVGSFYDEETDEETLTTVAGTFEWSEDGQGFSFTPDEQLDLGTFYTATVGEGAVTLDSGVALSGETVWNFFTVPEPAITGTSPADGDFARPYGGFTIFFASPMDTDTLRDRITIEPEPTREIEYFYRTYNNRYAVSFPPEPSTEYTITLDAGMADIYGNTIDESYTFSYTTDAYQPQLSLNVPGPVGLYNARREPTQLFISYRNVDRIEYSLYDVPLETLGRGLTSDGYYYDIIREYRPENEDLITHKFIPSPAPLNALRYDALTFSADADETVIENCSNGNVYPVDLGEVDRGHIIPLDTEDRVSFQIASPVLSWGEHALGDVFMVATEEPIPLRTSRDEEPMRFINPSDELTIINSYLNGCRPPHEPWLKVELPDGSMIWVEVVGDQAEILALVLDNFERPNYETGLDSGVYFLRVRNESTGWRDHMMVVATANVMVKTSMDTVMVWATDIESNQPVAGANITVYGRNFQEVATGITDENGLLLVDTPRADDLYDRYVVVLEGDAGEFGFGFTEWTDGIEPYQFGQSYDFYPKDFRIYVYTDRPVYRPGQPVYFRGIVRLKDDVAYTPPNLDAVPVTVTDDRGEIIFEDEVELTEFGSFSGELTLADDASLGFYRVRVDLSDPDAYYRDRETGSVSFGVAEYRLPEFQVDVTPEEREVLQGDTIEVMVDSTYFFGGAVSNAMIEYNVIANGYSFRYRGSGGRYDFVDYNYDEGASAFYATSSRGTIADGVATTDAAGEFTIEVPAELGEATQSQAFTIEAVVRDESDQSVAGRTEVIVHQGEVYVGVRPESYVSRAGEEANIEIIAVDWDSAGVADQAIEVEIVERRWSSVQEQDETGRTTWTYSVEEIPIADGEAVTGAGGLGTFTFTPPEGGVYKVYVRTRDSEGNRVVSSTTMWVSSSRYVSWRQQNSNRIDLIADQQEYTVGDTAEILITSPFQGTAEALITVERGDVLLMERVTMDSNSLVYELPITPEYAPNIFVSVLIVKGVDENNPVAGFRMGYIQLGVDTEQKNINIEVESDVDSASPQETVTYTVQTTDYAGNPIQTELGVGVTDLAALSLAAPNSRPLINFFYGDQSLSVRSSAGLTINTDQLTQETLDTIKGGGGGLAVDGIVEIRGEFIDTPYFNGSIVTDENGEATFDVRLPDNLTTWRLDARAITLAADDGNMLVGQETFDLLSTKPLIIRPVTPRFFVVDDEVVLAAVVNNNTDSDQDVVVTLDYTGLTLDAERAQVVTVPAGQRARVEWRATVDLVESVQLSFRADAGQFSDGAISGVSLDDEGTLPVYRYEVRETVGTAGTLSTADSREENIFLPQRFDVTQGELTVQVDQSLAASTIDGLDYLRNYPHQCVEQTVSRFLPNIMTFRALDQLELADAALQDGLDDAVFFALAKLYAEQKPDGGWGWFLNDVSNPLTTAYAIIGLYEARELGYNVSSDVISRAQEYLRNNLIAVNTQTNQWRLNRQAFLLYALARTEAPDVARTVNLYDNRDDLALYAKAYLAETFYYIDPADTSRSDVLLNDLISSASVSAAGIHWTEDFRDYWNWNTDTRTTALALSALVKLRPESDLLPNVVRYLMVQRTADAWETTQETAWTVMALTDWMAVSGELQPDYDYSVTLNGETLATGSAAAETVRQRDELIIGIEELLRDEANQLVFTRTGSNDGVMYYTAYLDMYLPVPEVEALDSGIILSREYSLQSDPDNTPITEARVGEIVEVRLTIIAPEDLHYVVIEDPLPAGAEAIDPGLLTSQQVGTRPGLDSANPLRYGWGWWWFSNIEFRDEKVTLYSTYLPRGTYEYVYTIRPGIVGEYNVIPPIGQEFYFPNVYGRGAGSTFTVLPADR